MTDLSVALDHAQHCAACRKTRATSVERTHEVAAHKAGDDSQLSRIAGRFDPDALARAKRLRTAKRIVCRPFNRRDTNLLETRAAVIGAVQSHAPVSEAVVYGGEQFHAVQITGDLITDRVNHNVISAIDGEGIVVFPKELR